MADNRIELIAELNPDDSIKEIKKNLESITNELNKNPIEIKCRISQSSISDIQNQLGKLTKSINVNVNANSIQNGLEVNKTNLAQQAKEIEKALNLVYPKGHTEELRNELKKLLADYQQAYDIEGGWGEQAQKNMTELIRFANSYRQEISLTNDDLRDTQEEIKRIKREQQQLFITADQYNALDNYARNNNTNAKNMLDKALGAGRWSANANTYKFDKPYYWSNFAESVNQINPLRDAIIDEGDIIQGIKDLSEFMDKSFIHIDDTLEKNEEAYIQWGNTVIETINSVTGRNPFGEQWATYDPDAVEETVQEVQRLKAANEAAAQAAKKIEYPKALDIQNNTDEILSNAKRVISEGLAQNAETAKDKVSRVTKAVEDAEGSLKSFIVQVEKENKSIETLTYALNEQGDAYEYVGKTIREADNSTDLRSKDLSTQWATKAEDLKKFSANAEKAGAASTILKEDIEELYQLLNNANPNNGGNTSTMNLFLDKFDIANAKLQAFNAEARKENAIANLQNRIKRLAAEVNKYAETNQRATKSMQQMSNGKTFAVEWSRITTEMAKGADLTDRELKDLSADMAVFRKEAQAAGLAGETAFGKFLNSFKTMSSYITANMVFNFAKRQIRELVNEVTAVDTAMVELRKVTEATDEQFAAFAISAGKTGRELGASISDVINATSTFSRAGFSLPEAEELGRIATLYKNVGDGIDIEGASESIISVMKAFNIEAEESERIIDRINKVSNNFAIDSGGLGLALQRVASAMRAANNTLDETIALTTVANEIVQNPEMVAQGWRTVALRIRGAKTELEDAGLETDGMVESTAKLRDLIKGISGVDIMIDENNFKSTYQIISELGKVWNNIKDVDQASLLEAIAGKRQSNIVAAALTNYERLDDVLQMSIDSMGSARAEQEEYAKSIQYSIDTLKAAYQDFADSVINSDFVKNLLKTAQSFLEVLTTIIDEFGALPTLLTSIVAIGGLKNIGLFGKWSDSVVTLTDKLSALRQVANYDFGKLYKIYEINMNDFKGFSPKEIKSLQDYVDLMGKGKVSTEQFNEIFAESRDEVVNAAKGFEKLNKSYRYGAVSEEEYAQATQNLALTQKTATTTSKALSIALNTLANVGIMIAINLAIKGISTLVDKLIVTKEELDEVRNSAIQGIENLSNSVSELTQKEDEVDELVKRYRTLINSTKDVSANKDELLKIQNDIIDKFGAEKDSLDLLNDAYDTTIAKIKELSDEEYKRIKRENSTDIARLKRILGYNVGYLDDYTDDVGGATDIFSKKWIKDTDQLAASLYLIEGVSEDIENIWKDIEGINFEDKFGNKNNLFLSGDIYEAYAQLGKLIDAINDSGIVNKEETLAPIVTRYTEIGQIIKEIDNYLQQKNAHEAEYVEVVGLASTATLAKLKELNQAAEDTRSVWFENFKQIQEGFDKTVDPIIKSIQSIADGDSLSSEDFWKIMELDTNHILTDIKMVGDQFVLNQDQLIALKDQYIQSQVDSIKLQNEEIENQKTQLINTIAQAEAELSILGARGMAVEAYRTEFAQAQKAIRDAKGRLVELENQQKRNNILVEEFNSKLGDTANYINRLKKEVEQLTNDLDDYVKAYEYRIDRIIDNLEDEVDVLNEQKSALQEELDVLIEQRDTIQETIDNYKTVADLVQDVVDKRKEELEAEKKAIEDTYNERINKLKEETEQREDAFEYAQKLANLENARNNKRRVYDEARGWRYESVKEDVVKAENDLAAFENSQAIKALEKERDEVIKTIDEQIEEQDKYAKYYKDTLDEIINQERELLAEQILGSNWRIDIANLDIETAEKFRTEYRNHNAALQNITRTEIKLKEEAIKAKDAEIKSKQEQINAWKKYKTDVQNAVKDVKEAQEGYMKIVRELDEKEPLTLDNRATAFESFKNRVVAAIGNITSMQSQIDNITSSFDGDHTYSMSFNIGNKGDLEDANATLGDIKNNFNDIADVAMRNFMAFNRQEGVVTWGSNDRSYSGAWGSPEIFGSHANGGVADYTGLAMLHGTKQRSETIFNANDSAKLYEMVHNTPNLMADMLNQATKLSGFKLSSNENTNNSSVSIGAINVYANNPTELTQGLDKTLDRYFRTKLTQSYTSKQ